ncbi:bifunctional hydroxymethylpyrimidine kinase/phosphomethylpyrimidine kinase [Cellulosilyticum ruminicola]|uniref:bifunctional hydroxymethylpyrimidine kinase/phosphomethylpyrimidine kinase n=1 Tax=Cellulosilyticum ruminicola TaxID=425254 RepID=UPI0006CFCF48|nr:bifunctional hydroxymethylpyrimidine kinase/phosphomethylpyrimidine kinase [Cellulosilyticum ruminicola]
MQTVLTIAGSDCSGGAGIQADIKTITAHGMYAMSAITALTAQNTTGVYGVQEATSEFVGQQIDCIVKDIRPNAVKIGMISSKEIMEVLAHKLEEYKLQNIVLDPVMISTSGSKLMSDDAIEIFCKKVMPQANLITPNLHEAACLADMIIHTKAEMIEAAKKIGTFFKGAILIKGGHLEETADDLLFINGEVTWFEAQRIENPNTHGTGCTLSSAIACNLAGGLDMKTSVANGKEYVTGAIAANLDLGEGNGPLNHCYKIQV